MDKDTPKTMAEKYDEKMKVNKENKNKSLKDKFKELADINTKEAVEISFKIDSNVRKKLTTFIILFLLIIGSIWIKYSSTKSVDANLETREELNDMLHMKNLFKYPNYDDVMNNKDMFKGALIYADAIVIDEQKESDDFIKIKVSMSESEEKIAYLYYIKEDKDIILRNEKISFIGKIKTINTNKNYIEIDALRIDTGSGLYTETDLQKIASLYAQNESVSIVNTTETINSMRYGSGYKNYSFDITKLHESNFPNEFRIIDFGLTTDIIDSTSNKNEVYSRIDINEDLDRFIKMKKDFKNNTFTLEFYDLNYKKVFDKTWKNVHTSDKFAYDYVSSDGKFYINIENVIYVFDESDGKETKFNVTGRGYIDVDFKGYIYYLSLDEDGYVACYTENGKEVWKESLVSGSDLSKFEVRGINEIAVVNNTDVLVEFEASKIHPDRKDPEEYEFAIFKTKSGIRVNDTLDD